MGIIQPFTRSLLPIGQAIHSAGARAFVHLAGIPFVVKNISLHLPIHETSLPRAANLRHRSSLERLGILHLCHPESRW